MMRDIAFGQYYPKNSFVHNLDPRTKIFSSIVLIVAVFLVDNYWGYVACYSFLAIMILASRIPILSILKTIKAVLVIMLITFVINVLFYKSGHVYAQWWIFTITREGIIFGVYMILRIVFLVMSMSLLTFTTTPMALTDGIENLLKPLTLIKIPVHDLATIMSIALRFIPTLTEEVDKIILAQKARGAAFDTGNIFKKAKAMLPILIPLFVSTFRRADELAMALDSRCYNATDKRTKMKPLKFSYRDLLGVFIIGAFLTIIIMIKLGFFGLIQ
ncbi:MAG: energy-coupling factor transporter transmembrane protein EcfT [Clostridia bacterium]|nr:energy-coupling factor transporter transmembrane protein EcfT [Clostridia bacterium]